MTHACHNKYGGLLIHSETDEHGVLEVVDTQQKFRSLHFGNATQQSGMFFYNPYLLLHKYTQAFMTPFCWSIPRRILLLGLGAGSMVKFIAHHFPNVHIDAVELRPRVTHLAQTYFMLPEQSKRFRVFHTTAENFIETWNQPEYDLILVDLFLTAGRKNINVNLEKHLVQLEQMLARGGSICFNTLGINYTAYPGYAELKKLFKNRLNIIDVESSNTVLLGLKNLPSHTVDELEMMNLEIRTGLPLRQYYNQVRTTDF